MVLVYLSIFIVFGFSKLALDRQKYLLIGLIGLIAVYFSAAPMIKRTKKIARSCNNVAETISATVNIFGVSADAEKLTTHFINSAINDEKDVLEKVIPENHWLIILLALAQLTLASGIGMWIGEGIDELSHLIPIALMATIADVWSVSAGATSVIIISPSIHYFLLRFPIIGTNEIAFLIGLSDFLFFTIFFQAATRYKLGVLKNTILLSSSFIIAIAAALFFRTGLPVLPFMAALFVIGNWKNLTINKKEIKQIAFFLIGVLIVFAVATKLLH